MSLAKANKNLKFDTRLADRDITVVGEVTKEEWQKHLEQLPDQAHNAITFTIDNKNHSSEDSH